MVAAPTRGGEPLVRLMPDRGPVDLDHCPTCDQAWTSCGALHPGFTQDVVPVRCQLPRGHCSEEHWHATLWPATPDLLWFDEREHEPDLEGPPRRRQKVNG